MTLYRFGELELDHYRFELKRCGRPIKVQRIVFETLLYFLQSRGRVVKRSDLMEGPWKGTKVSDGSVRQAIMLVRKAISDEAGEAIVTVHGVGYRFELTVTRADPGLGVNHLDPVDRRSQLHATL